MSYVQDNIIPILKSIVPIKYKYSQKNKKLDKTFKYMSLDNLLKKLDYKPKIYDEFAPDPEFLNRKNQFDINFQSSNEYINELSDLNNLPLVMKNKNFLKNGTFNPDYEVNPVKDKNEQKKILLEKERRKKEILQIRIDRLKKWKESQSIVDPGKYHPNYDFVKKRIPSVYIRKPMIKKMIKKEDDEKYNNKINNNIKDENLKEENKNDEENINQNNNDNNNNEIISKIDDTNNNKDENSRNKNKDLNESHSQNDNSSINNNFSKISIKRNIYSNYCRNMKKNSGTYFGRNTSTVSDYNNALEGNKSTNAEETSLFHNIFSGKKKISKDFSLPRIGKRKINYFKPIKNKRNRFRSSSLGNLNKNPIVFRKMLGRDDAVFCNNNINLISYFPNYEYTLPHIPSYTFKYKNNIQDYKKYITGKIIRGYYYSPNNYFLIEFKKNKNKKINIYKEREKMKKNLRKKIK